MSIINTVGMVIGASAVGLALATPGIVSLGGDPNKTYWQSAAYAGISLLIAGICYYAGITLYAM